MTYAIDSRSRVRVRVRPFRLIAALLSLIVFFLLFAILSTPTYERELMMAKQAYRSAAMENARLREELREASQMQAEPVIPSRRVSAP